MRNVDDLRQHSYCRACGLVVVDLVCPFCNSTIDEPVIYEAKIGYRSRFTSITGVFLLIVAGVTPAIVSASEKNESLSVSSRPVVVSTTTTAAPAKESTSTTVDRSSDQNTVQNTKTPTVQKPSRVETPPRTGVHGRKLGRYQLWTQDEKDKSGSRIVLVVERIWIYVTIDFPREFIQPPCSGIEYQEFFSLDGGATTSKRSDVWAAGCSAQQSYGYLYKNSSWRDPLNRDLSTNALLAPPGPFHVKTIATAMDRVFETPWVLVNMNTVP